MRRGLALILVVGILAVLAVLGSAFAILSRLERRASVQRALATRATLLARSGVEDALARISSGQDPSDRWNRYRGEDWNDDGLVSGLESAAEVFRKGVANLADCPVESAMAPSFFKRHATDLDSKNRKAPERIRVDGRERGWSGRLDGQAYALKVEDESGKINVNGGLLGPLSNASAGWNDQLVLILDVLGEQPEVGIPFLGQLAVQARPPAGYASVRALQKAVGFPNKDLSPWITVHSWSDPKVVRPNASADPYAFWNYFTVTDLKLSRPPLLLEQGGRPPVNLNAAERPVLVALLKNLSAYCCSHEIFDASGYMWENSLFSIPRMDGSATADPLLAEKIADKMVLARPWADWPAFERFCDGLIPDPITGFNRDDPNAIKDMYWGGNCVVADLIKANFDPNTKVVKQLPDQLLWRWIDKTDLISWTTEGSLGPTGSFRIASVGRILSPDGRLLASGTLEERTEAFALFRHTTQKDFVGGRSLSPMSEPRYLSLAPHEAPTAGISAPGAWWGGGPPPVDGLGRRVGAGAMTYPCAPPALPAQAADFDGYVGLASVETDASFPPTGGVLTFAHHFNDWDAQVGNPKARDPAFDGPLQWSLDASVWPEDTSIRPNTLLPDGLHAHPGSSPGWDAYGNLPTDTSSDHGVLSFWLKSGCDWGYGLTYVNAFRQGQSGGTQNLILARQGGRSFFILENAAFGTPPPAGTPMEDLGIERQVRVQPLPNWKYLKPGMRWELVTAYWDTDEVLMGEQVSLTARSVLGSAACIPHGDYGDPYLPSLGQTLVEAGAKLRLGEPAGFWDGVLTATYVSQVMDEFEICDFQDLAQGVNGSIANAALWADQKFQRGRYYKGDGTSGEYHDAFFRSPLVEPDPGRNVLLLSARWTAYLPREKRKELLCSDMGLGSDIYGWMYLGPDVPTDRVVDKRLLKAAVEVDLREGSDPDAGLLQALGQGERINRSLPGFRYRVTFRSVPLNPATGLEDPLNQPVLETPFFDDVTFTYQRQGGPRVLSVERP